MPDINNLAECKSLIRTIYEQHNKRRIELGSQTPAAVLVPLFEKNRQVNILFAKRTQTVRHHKGQISFPGGALDPGDRDLSRAALRETEEEIGIRQESVEIIAELEPTARGPYCGSLGYIGFDGAMDLSILIRTITAGRGWWQMPVGGGIVVASEPRLEYEETWHKAAGLIRSLLP